MKLLINERLKATATKAMKHSFSIYRDLLFLSFVAIGREDIDDGEFI